MCVAGLVDNVAVDELDPKLLPQLLYQSQKLTICNTVESLD